MAPGRSGGLLKQCHINDAIEMVEADSGRTGGGAGPNTVKSAENPHEYSVLGGARYGEFLLRQSSKALGAHGGFLVDADVFWLGRRGSALEPHLVLVAAGSLCASILRHGAQQFP